MVDTGDDTAVGPKVGDRVQIQREDGAAWGVIVDDYGTSLSLGPLGRDWAPPHRWAIALDPGTLAFVDPDSFLSAGDRSDDDLATGAQ